MRYEKKERWLLRAIVLAIFCKVLEAALGVFL
jgi:hypothetical protein